MVEETDKGQLAPVEPTKAGSPDRSGSRWDFLKKLTPIGRRELQKRRAWEASARSSLVNQLGEQLWHQTAGYNPADAEEKEEPTIKRMHEIVAFWHQDRTTNKGLTDIEVKSGIKQALVRQFSTGLGYEPSFIKKPLASLMNLSKMRLLTE